MKWSDDRQEGWRLEGGEEGESITQGRIPEAEMDCFFDSYGTAGLLFSQSCSARLNAVLALQEEIAGQRRRLTSSDGHTSSWIQTWLPAGGVPKEPPTLTNVRSNSPWRMAGSKPLEDVLLLYKPKADGSGFSPDGDPWPTRWCRDCT